MNRRFFSPAAAAALMLASVSVWSCMKDELTEEGFQLHYPDCCRNSSEHHIQS